MKPLLFNYWWISIGLVAVLLLICLAFVIGSIQMTAKINTEIDNFKSIEANNDDIIEATDLIALPEPVQRWLTYTGVVGTPRIISVEFKQSGLMRLDPDETRWIESDAMQYVRVDEPAFLWHVNLSMLPIIKTRGRDFFIDGDAEMEVKIGGLIAVVNENNNVKLNESALHRFLLELPWYPTAALEDYITWEEVDENRSKAVLTYQGIQVSAIFTFDAVGKLHKIEALRYYGNDSDAKRIPCIGVVTDYAEFNGLQIPYRFEVTWMLDENEYTWYKLKNSDFVFNAHE